VPGGPEDLGDHGGAVRGLAGIAEGAQRVVALDLEADPGVGQALADHGILGPAVALRGLDDLAELTAEAHLLAEGGGAALEGERGQGDLPALTGGAQDVLLRRACAVEEDLAELRVAGDLDDGPDLDPFPLHGDQQVGETLVALRIGVGAADEEAPVRPFGPGGPYLLAVDHPLVALEAGLGLHVGEVGAGVGLRVALAPDLLALQDRR